MNKVTKGALATVAGVALLLGGGGTLAVWNQTANAPAATIAAGDLGLTTDAAGTWTSNLTGSISADSIGTYKIVPGETLTFKQNLTLKLIGNGIQARLTAIPGSVSTSSPTNNPFEDKNVIVTTKYTRVVNLVEQELTASTILTKADHGSVVTASTTFAFDKDKTVNLEDVTATYDFGKVAYKLEQYVA